MKLKVLYINGSDSLQLFWLTFLKNDVYYGRYSKLTKGSYHQSGRAHIKVENKLITKSQKIPLKNFKGVHKLDSFTLPNTQQMFEFTEPPKNKKTDLAMIIDSRTLKNDILFNITVGLVEVEGFKFFKTHILPSVESGLRNNVKQLLISTEVTPWVWVRLMVLDTTEFKLY